MILRRVGILLSKGKFKSVSDQGVMVLHLLFYLRVKV